MAEKKGSGKKAISSIVIVIVAIALIIVLLASSILAIFEAIIGWIIDMVADIISGIVDFFRDPLGTLQKWGAGIENFFSKALNSSNFNEAEYEALRTDPVIVISDEQILEVVQKMDENINRNIAGLNNVMLKKMILAYYKGLYLDDTDILIEITQEDFEMAPDEWNKLFQMQKYKKADNTITGVAEGAAVGATIGTFIGGPGWGTALGGAIGSIFGGLTSEESIRFILTKNGKNTLISNYGDQIEPFEIVEGDPDALKGEDGKIYLKTKGMLKIFTADSFVDSNNNDVDDYCAGCTRDAKREKCKYTLDNNEETNCYYKIKYYSNSIPEGETKSPFQKLYNHYRDNFNKGEGRSNYTEAVKKYLVKCYTYTSEGIMMYSTRTTKSTEKTWEYENESTEASAPDNLWENIFGASTENRTRKIKTTPSYPLTSQNLVITQKIAEYAVPVEFMIDLLEITSSRDFVNSFIKKACSSDYYVALKLYEMQNVTGEYEVEEKNRTTVVKGERKYTAQISRYKPEGSEEWKNWSTQQDNAQVQINKIWKDGKTTVQVGLNNATKGTVYEVKLYVNGRVEKTTELSITEEHFLWITWDDDNTEQAWKFPYPDNNTWTDTSKVIETTAIQKEELYYAIGITEIRTWYASISATNKIERSYYVDNLQGTQYSNSRVNIAKITEEEFQKGIFVWFAELQNAEETIKTISYSDRNYSEKRPQILVIKDFDTVIAKRYEDNPNELYTQEECLNVQLNYVIQKTDNSYGASNYKLTEMTYSDKNINTTTLYMGYGEVLHEGIDEGVYTYTKNYKPFLSLLSNKSGTKDDPEYKPLSSGGELIEYDGLYGNKVEVGTRLEQTSEMLYELLAQSGHNGGTASRESLVDVMKRILNYYSSGNYSMSDPDDLNIYEDNDFVNVGVN